MLIRLQEPLGPWMVNSISSATLPIQLLPMESIYNCLKVKSLFFSSFSGLKAGAVSILLTSEVPGNVYGYLSLLLNCPIGPQHGCGEVM